MPSPPKPWERDGATAVPPDTPLSTSTLPTASTSFDVADSAAPSVPDRPSSIVSHRGNASETF
jgi:hypothetical protein